MIATSLGSWFLFPFDSLVTRSAVKAGLRVFQKERLTHELKIKGLKLVAAGRGIFFVSYVGGSKGRLFARQLRSSFFAERGM